MVEINRDDVIKVSAPGRICLLGEHQDYIGLPVIPAAIDLRIAIIGIPREDSLFRVDLPDINSHDEFSFDEDIPYLLERDYVRSVVNVLRREGVILPHGYDVHISGNIPINSGTSSSSALCVAWVKFILDAARDPRGDDPEKVANLAYIAEVEEFGEPGGMMDHTASAVGGVMHVEFKPAYKVTRLPVSLGTFVLGDSRQEKDTKKTLARIKKWTLSAVEKIRQRDPEFTLACSSIMEIGPFLKILDDEERDHLEGAMMTRDIVARAKDLFSMGKMDDLMLGHLLNAQQDVLREKMSVTTDKLEMMIGASLEAGALGAKINGSGEGGCMFAYAPDDAGKVAEAIEGVGGKAYVISVGKGVSRD